MGKHIGWMNNYFILVVDAHNLNILGESYSPPLYFYRFENGMQRTSSIWC